VVTNQLGNIEHVVVLMLENRSFDHMLGLLYSGSGNVSPSGQSFAGLTGHESNVDGSGNVVPVSQITPATPNAFYMPGADPGEGYVATNLQLFGSQAAPVPPVATNGGFVTNFAATLAWETAAPGWSVVAGTTADDIMGAFTPVSLPVMSGLARGFAVCDQWFASAPTETMPNRAFVNAATSQGHLDDKTKSFTCPSIFGALTQKQVSWSIYGYDSDPLTRLNFADTTAAPDANFGVFSGFQAAAKEGTLPSYTFLEPSWSSSGNSQHPNYDVALGEQFILAVYQAVRSSPAWNSTLLVITYDEHGGCYDHVAPPSGATPPDSSVGEFGFDFSRFGVRVPAVLVSPWIEAGTVYRAPAGGPPLDHTSILKTVELLFGVAPLTARDAAAPDLGGALTARQPRTDDPLAGVVAPTSSTPNPSAGLPSHLQEIHADLVAALPVPGTSGSQEPMPPLRTDADYRRFIDSRTAAWKATHTSAG
jgi:phospholipase C